MTLLTLQNLHDVDELASPLEDNRISRSSPATDVFTDFTRHTPLVIDASVSASAATALMKRTHVRLKFVINEQGKFVGIVSRDDLNSQEIMKRLAVNSSERDELMVTDFMRPRAQLKAFDFQMIRKVTIDDVINALKLSGEQHCLVVDNEQHKIRGIISASDIARKLHLSIDIHDQSSFVRIFQAIHA